MAASGQVINRSSANVFQVFVEPDQLDNHLELQDHFSFAATARSEAAVRRSEAAAAALSARRALERELDEDSQRRRAPPSTDGFADTQVMAHETEASSLLVQ